MRQVSFVRTWTWPELDSLHATVVQVRISDLSSVDINWRMLTLARPETKIEEEIFSK